MPEQKHKSVASESTGAREFKGWLSLSHQCFFLCAHFKLSDLVGFKHSCFIYLLFLCPKDTMLTSVLIYYYYYYGEDRVVLK